MKHGLSLFTVWWTIILRNKSPSAVVAQRNEKFCNHNRQSLFVTGPLFRKGGNVCLIQSSFPKCTLSTSNSYSSSKWRAGAAAYLARKTRLDVLCERSSMANTPPGQPPKAAARWTPAARRRPPRPGICRTPPGRSGRGWRQRGIRQTFVGVSVEIGED